MMLESFTQNELRVPTRMACLYFATTFLTLNSGKRILNLENTRFNKIFRLSRHFLETDSACYGQNLAFKRLKLRYVLAIYS